MPPTSFAELDSPQCLRTILAERGYFPDEAPADELFDLPPGLIGMLRDAQIVALTGPAFDDNTLVVVHVPQDALSLDVLRRIRRRLAENIRDRLIFYAKDWQKTTLYLLRQEDILQPGREQSANDTPLRWKLNFNALRHADRQGLTLLDLCDQDPHKLGTALLRAFRRVQRPTICQNQGLFSNYYLNEQLDTDNNELDDYNDTRKATWRSLLAKMEALRSQVDAALPARIANLALSATEAQIIRPMLHGLG